jgi:glucan phosphoethanolaminetransferase (alkaline phosphatase superfamily)
MVLLPSFFGTPAIQKAVAYVIQASVVYLGILCIQESKRELNVGLSLGFTVLIINWLGIFEDDATINFYLSFMIFMVFYAYLAYRLLFKIFETHKVTPGVLFASINIYLLLGIIGAFAFMLIENIQPGSLHNLQLEDLTHPSRFYYFSFSTLTTVGYGDITPTTSSAQAIAILLSTSGQLYLTIIVAIIVGRYIYGRGV